MLKLSTRNNTRLLFSLSVMYRMLNFWKKVGMLLIILKLSMNNFLKILCRIWNIPEQVKV